MRVRIWGDISFQVRRAFYIGEPKWAMRLINEKDTFSRPHDIEYSPIDAGRQDFHEKKPQ